jgi:hypothetical protein
MIIGDSIQDAIDWTQDHLRTTRPLAEGTLFSLLQAAVVRETEHGYVLNEAEEEEAEKHFNKLKNNTQKNRSRFRSNSKHSKRTRIHTIKRRYNLDSSDAADDMLASDDDKSAE